LSALVACAAMAAFFLGCEGDYTRPSEFTDVNSLNRPDCRLGVFKGTGPEKIARHLFPNAEIIVFDDAGEAGASLLGGHLEGFIGAEHILNVACRTYPLRLRVLDEALDWQPSRVLVNKRNERLLGEIDAFIESFKRDGTYDDMFLRWCASDKFVPMPTLPEPVGTNGVLRVGMCGLIEPSNYIDEEGKLTGYDVEFALRLGLALGRTVSFRLDPYRNYFGALLNDEIDVVIDNWNDPDLRPGIAASEGYLDSDTKVLIAEAQPGLEERVDALMLEGTRFGLADALIKDLRIRLFVNGFVNTISITLLAVLFGFWFARMVRIVERRLPRWAVCVVDGLVVFIRWTPPIVLLLIFRNALMASAAPWLTAVVAFSVWFAAFMEPVAAHDPLVWLPVLRLRLPVLLQWTCVVGYISVFDLTMAVDLVCGRSIRAIVPLLAVALAYGLLEQALDAGAAWYERRIRR